MDYKKEIIISSYNKLYPIWKNLKKNNLKYKKINRMNYKKNFIYKKYIINDLTDIICDIYSFSPQTFNDLFYSK